VSTDRGDGKAADARGHGHIRASNADREQVIDALKAAFIQGRLAKDELELRVGQTLVSRTYAELAALTGDLPPWEVAARPPRTRARAGERAAKAAAGVGLALALLAAAALMGTGDVPQRLIGLAVFFIPIAGVSVGGLVMFHSWLENRARRKLPQGPAGGIAGPASQRTVPGSAAGSRPRIGQPPPHTAEAAPRHRHAPAIARLSTAP
jgi:Domain of unknown function (DUF1707)